jgi:membrane protease YdiL (CAAX protease family)
MRLYLTSNYHNILLKYSKLSLVKLVLLSLLLIICYSRVADIITTSFDIKLYPYVEESNSLLLLLLTTVIIGPIAETFMMHYLTIELMLLKFPKQVLLALFISSIAFGLAHYFSIYYIIYAFILGLVFATFYMVVKAKNKNAFWMTSLLHGLFNALTMGINYLLM